MILFECVGALQHTVIRQLMQHVFTCCSGKMIPLFDLFLYRQHTSQLVLTIEKLLLLGCCCFFFFRDYFWLNNSKTSVKAKLGIYGFVVVCVNGWLCFNVAL